MSLFLTGFGAITCIADNSERLCPTNWYVQYGLNLLLAIAVVSAAAIFLLTYIYRSYWRYAAREVERIRYRRVLRRSLFLLVPVCVIATTVSLVLS